LILDDLFAADGGTNRDAPVGTRSAALANTWRFPLRL